MTKKDILDILYAERNRLLSVYTRPGWTTWALFAAIGSLIWILIDLRPFSLKYSIAITYMLFNAFVLVICLILSLKNNHQPTWKKLEFTDRVGIIYIFAILIVQFLIFVLHKTFFAGGILGWLYYVAVTINAILLLVFIVAFVLTFIPSLRTEKDNRKGGIIGAVIFLLLLIVWGLFIFREHNQIDVYSLKAGLMFFAIAFLIGCFNISTPSKLNKLDNLINKVLYEGDEIDEKKIMSELETCMIGLKYRDFLMNDNYDYISKWTRYLYWNLCILNNEATTISDDYNENIRSIVKDSMERITHLQPRINYVLKMLKWGYDEKDLDPKLSPLLRVMQDSLDLIGFWHEIWKKMSEYNFEDFSKFVSAKQQEADIIFKERGTDAIVQ